MEVRYPPPPTKGYLWYHNITPALLANILLDSIFLARKAVWQHTLGATWPRSVGGIKLGETARANPKITQNYSGEVK